MHRHKVAKVRFLDRAEGGALFVEEKVDLPRRAVAVLFDKYFGDVGLFCAAIRIHFIFAMDEHNHVGILFYRSAVAKVGEARAAATLLHCTGELGERQDGDIELTGHAFERARNFRNLLHHTLTGAPLRRRNELQVVHDDESKILFHFQSPRHRAHRQDARCRLIVDIDRGLRKVGERLLEPIEIFVVFYFACAQTPRINPCLRCKHTIDKLLRAHFEREDTDRSAVLGGGLPRDIERECRLTHTRSRCEDDQV